MTVCNMSIEGGARAGLVAPDQKAFDFLRGRPKSPKAAAWDAAMRYWEKLRSDESAHFYDEIRLDAAKLPPIVTWGTSPEDVISVTGMVPDPDKIEDEAKRLSKHRALKYMGLIAGTKVTEIKLDRVFIGSCTNGRIEDCAPPPRSPKARRQRACQCDGGAGSGIVGEQAEAEGLEKIFIKAGFEWREPGCSMCLAMNPDSSRRRSAAPRPRTAISRAARASRAAPIWSRRQWRRRRRSPGISSMSGSGGSA